MDDPSKPNQSNHNPLQCPPLPTAPTPLRGHRRAHSEIQFRLPEDLDLSEPFGGFDELGSEDDLFCSYMDIEKFGSGSGSASESADPSAPRSDNPYSAENGGVGRDEAGNSRPRHRHSLSVDGSSTMESIEAKKAMAPDKLAELWVVDPKRAKRFHLSTQNSRFSKPMNSSSSQIVKNSLFSYNSREKVVSLLPFLLLSVNIYLLMLIG